MSHYLKLLTALIPPPPDPYEIRIHSSAEDLPVESIPADYCEFLSVYGPGDFLYNTANNPFLQVYDVLNSQALFNRVRAHRMHVESRAADPEWVRVYPEVPGFYVWGSDDNRCLGWWIEWNDRAWDVATWADGFYFERFPMRMVEFIYRKLTEPPGENQGVYNDERCGEVIFIRRE